MAFIIRQLGPTGYGQWAVATSLLAVSTVLTNLGLRGAFVRAVAATRLGGAGAGRPTRTPAASGRVVVGDCPHRLRVAPLSADRPPVASPLGAAGLDARPPLRARWAICCNRYHRVKTLAGINLAAGVCPDRRILARGRLRRRPDRHRRVISYRAVDFCRRHRNRRRTPLLPGRHPRELRAVSGFDDELQVLCRAATARCRRCAGRGAAASAHRRHAAIRLLHRRDAAGNPIDGAARRALHRCLSRDGGRT